MSELAEFISSTILEVYRKTIDEHDSFDKIDEEYPRWAHLVDVYLRNTGLSAEIDFETLRVIMEECPEIASKIYGHELYSKTWKSKGYSAQRDMCQEEI